MNGINSDSGNENVIVKSAELLFIFKTKDGKLKVVHDLVDSSYSKSLCKESLAELLKGAIIETNKSTTWKIQADIFKTKNTFKVNDIKIP